MENIKKQFVKTLLGNDYTEVIDFAKENDYDVVEQVLFRVALNMTEDSGDDELMFSLFLTFIHDNYYHQMVRNELTESY